MFAASSTLFGATAAPTFGHVGSFGTEIFPANRASANMAGAHVNLSSGHLLGSEPGVPRKYDNPCSAEPSMHGAGGNSLPFGNNIAVPSSTLFGSRTPSNPFGSGESSQVAVSRSFGSGAGVPLANSTLLGLGVTMFGSASYSAAVGPGTRYARVARIQKPEDDNDLWFAGKLPSYFTSLSAMPQYSGKSLEELR